jgi:hypothetical protein
MKIDGDRIYIPPDNYVDKDIFPFWPPREPAESDPKYIKHVVCEGARFHVVHWDNKGAHCSERRCILNKREDA